MRSCLMARAEDLKQAGQGTCLSGMTCDLPQVSHGKWQSQQLELPTAEPGLTTISLRMSGHIESRLREGGDSFNATQLVRTRLSIITPHLVFQKLFLRIC